MKETQQYTMGELFTLEYGKPVPDKESIDGSVPVYGTNGQIGTSHLKPLCNHPSVILGRKGAYRGVHYSNRPFSVIDTAFYIELITDKVDIKWLYYKLLTYDINSMDSGSAIPSTDRYQIYSLPIEVPSISTQRRIVDVLDSITTKIELNRQINDNLEQQAKALYKSWFVDFEPFKDGDFIESEIGEIPAGWSIVKFSDISETPKKTINPQKFPDTTFYHYSLPACDNGLIPEIQIGKDIMSNKIIMQNNTTLFSKLNPRIKRIWFTGEVLPNSICSTEFIPFRAKYDMESSYIFSIVNSDAFYATVMGCVNGATGSHQRFHAEDTEDFLCPYNKDVVNEFSKLVEPILSQIHDLRHENVMLASTRDALLPKLMSGELKINEIDC